MKIRQHTEVRDRVLALAGELFLKFGYSRITMGDIASSSGISKKTLYDIFMSKEELLREYILLISCTAKDQIDVIISNNETDVIDKLKKLMKLIRTLYAKIEGPLIDDLHKYTPDLWQQVIEFDEEIVVRYFIKIIDQGIGKKVFKEDVDKRLIAVIFLGVVKKLTNEILSQIPFSDEQILESIIKIILFGIFTDEKRSRYI